MARPPETEKITINIGHVDLGRVDLLVQEGFYSNRSDFIRTAIRNQLNAESAALAASVDRHMLVLGLRDITRDELEEARQAGTRLSIRVVGLVRMADDIPPDLARATISNLTVLGALQAPKPLKDALKDRIS